MGPCWCRKAGLGLKSTQPPWVGSLISQSQFGSQIVWLVSICSASSVESEHSFLLSPVLPLCAVPPNSVIYHKKKSHRETQAEDRSPCEPSLQSHGEGRGGGSRWTASIWQTRLWVTWNWPGLSKFFYLLLLLFFVLRVCFWFREHVFSDWPPSRVKRLLGFCAETARAQVGGPRPNVCRRVHLAGGSSPALRSSQSEPPPPPPPRSVCSPTLHMLLPLSRTSSAWARMTATSRATVRLFDFNKAVSLRSALRNRRDSSICGNWWTDLEGLMLSEVSQRKTITAWSHL